MTSSYLESIYRSHFGLLTDLYELTMAYGYWKEKVHEREAIFSLFFRKRPFQGSFAVAAGLEVAVEFLERLRFEADDLRYLETLKSDSGKPLFEAGFLDYLSTFKFTCHLDAVPEGVPVLPYEPLLRVQGPVLQAQIVESALLAIVNFQTLIATKAARIVAAAHPDPIVEFGLRRAQGIDGAIAASRAAYIGGCESTSNVLAGKLFGIPVRGTHAHSWVMLFESEEEAHRAFAKSFPEGAIFLVDTYETLKGVRRVIEMAKEGVPIGGIRLDSGELAALSNEARKLLDKAGLKEARIMASNELDEILIADLKQKGAKITIWGVGTHLVTGKGQPALDGVYKLVAVKNAQDEWRNTLKVSDQIAKVTDPGPLQVRRFFDKGSAVCDMLFDASEGIGEPSRTSVDRFDPARKHEMPAHFTHEDLLVPILRKGKRVFNFPSLHEMRKTCLKELARFPQGVRRLTDAQPFEVGIEKSLALKKLKMIEEAHSK